VAPKPHLIEITYEGRAQDRYRITLDAGAPKLVIASNDDPRSDWFLTADRIKAVGTRLASAVFTAARGSVVR
jgi:hypothetical protein